MRSLRAPRLLSSLTVLLPLITLACSDDAAGPTGGSSGGAAGASGRAATAGTGAAPASAGAAGSGAKGGAGGAAGDGAGGAAGGNVAAGAGGEATTGGAGGGGTGGMGAGAGGTETGQGGAGSGGGGGGTVAGAAGAAGGGAGGAPGSGGGGSEPGGAGGAPSTKKRGTVRLSQIYQNIGFGTAIGSSMSGSFQGPVQPDPTQTCTTRTEGPCSVEKCTLTGAAGAPAQPYLDAGNISTVGAEKPAFISFNNSKSGYTTYSGGGDLLWKGGELIGVEAQGGPDIPTFSTQVKAPRDTVLWALPQATGGYYTIDMDSPYQVSWNASANATIELSIATTGPKATATVRCSFDPADSPSSIPPSLLGDLFRGGGAELTIESVNRSTVSLPDADIDVSLAYRTLERTAVVTGIGHVGPTDPAVCAAAAEKTAASCPGTPYSAATCASGDDACDYCLSQKPGDCIAAAGCDKFCGVVTPGSGGMKAGIGTTPICNQSCKTAHCDQELAAEPPPFSLAIAGDVVFIHENDKGLLYQVSAAGGVPTPIGGKGMRNLQVAGGAVFGSYNGTLKSTVFSTGKTQELAPPAGTATRYKVDEAGVAFALGSTGEVGVADLEGKNGRIIAKLPKVPGEAFDVVTSDATYVYLLIGEAGKSEKIMRVARSAPASTNPPETVLAGIPIEKVPSFVFNLQIIGDAAFFVEDRSSTLTRVDLNTKAITKLALPKAVYTDLRRLGTVLYAPSDKGVARIDSATFSVTGDYKVGSVGVMTMDSERIYYRRGSDLVGSLHAFCQ